MAWLCLSTAVIFLLQVPFESMSTPTNFTIDSFEEKSGLERFLDQHFKKIALLILLAVVAVAGIFLRRSMGESLQQEASQKLGEAKTLEQIEAVREKYADTPSAFLASLKAAQLWQEKGDAAKAEQELRAALAKNPQHPAANNARLLLASLLRATKPDEANALYQEVAKQSTPSFLAPYALSQSASIALQKGDEKKADQLWQDASSQFAGNQLTRVAQYEALILKAKAPAEVDVPAKPAEPMSLAPVSQP